MSNSVDLAGRAVLVLGAGMQGRTVVEDLERRSSVGRIIVADRDAAAVRAAVTGARRAVAREVDAQDTAQLLPLLGEVDLVVNMLPGPFEEPVLRLAIEAGVHLVSTNYGHALRALDEAAARRGIVVMPEAGFDPGIDLVIARQAIDEFDEMDTLLSYGAGIPAPDCRDTNAINYKISWSFEGLLRAYARPARVVADGEPREVAAARIFDADRTHTVTVDGVGELEAFVNGDAVEFLDLLGTGAGVRSSARYSLRWPGHCEFWRRLASLGFLEETRAADLPLAPREFLRRHLEPRLQYGPGERDMIVLRVDAAGRRAGRREAMRWELVDYGDASTGELAMSRAVGCAASVVAQMILGGEVTRPGVGSPARDVPPAPFLAALERRGIRIRRERVV